MFVATTHPGKTLAVTLAVVGLVCGPRWCVSAGDQITFSNQKGQIDLPSANLKLDQDKSKPFDFLQRKKSTLGGDLPEITPSLSPSSLRGKRLREMEKYIDQQRNWIFLTPDNLKTTATPEETFGVDEPTLTGQDQKPKKLLEQYWENMGQDGQSKSNRVSVGSSSDGDKLDVDPRGSSSGLLPGTQSAATQPGERGLSPLLDQLRAPDGLGRTLADLPGSRALLSDPLATPAMKPVVSDRLSQSKMQASDAEFRKLIQPTGTTAPLSGFNDPINAPLDQARMSITPVAPSRSVETAAGNGLSDALPSFNGAGRGASMTGLDLLNTRSIGPSSLSPILAAPAVESPFNQARPAVLEIPRPRF